MKILYILSLLVCVELGSSLPLYGYNIWLNATHLVGLRESQYKRTYVLQNREYNWIGWLEILKNASYEYKTANRCYWSSRGVNVSVINESISAKDVSRILCEHATYLRVVMQNPDAFTGRREVTVYTGSKEETKSVVETTLDEIKVKLRHLSGTCDMYSLRLPNVHCISMREGIFVTVSANGTLVYKDFNFGKNQLQLTYWSEGICVSTSGDNKFCGRNGTIYPRLDVSSMEFQILLSKCVKEVKIVKDDVTLVYTLDNKVHCFSNIFRDDVSIWNWETFGEVKMLNCANVYPNVQIDDRCKENAKISPLCNHVQCSKTTEFLFKCDNSQLKVEYESW